MIHNIRVRNFKSLHDVTVRLNALTVLVGQSGTGKSNFVKAIRFLRDYLVTSDRDKASHGDLKYLGPAGTQKFVMNFDVHFEIRGVPEPFYYSLQIPFGEGYNDESLRLGETVLFHYQNNGWVVAPNVSPNPRIETPMLGRLPAVSEAVIAYAALTSGIGCYDFPFGVLAHPKNAAAESGLDDNGQNFLPVMKAIYSNLRDLNLRRSILASVSTLNRTVAAVELDSITAPQRVYITHKFNGTKIQFELLQESEGFRRFLAHILAIYQEPPKQTLVFEEPENGIYPGALSLLAEELSAAPELNRGQVILTTHSPGLLDYFRAEDLRVVALQNGATQIGPVAPEQLAGVREGLLTTGELLTVDPARLEEAEPTGA